MVELDVLKAQLLADIAAAGDEQAIEAVRVAALGKKGSVSELLKTLGAMTPEERQTRGAAINALKNEITEEIATRKAALKDAAINARLKAERELSLELTDEALDKLVAVGFDPVYGARPLKRAIQRWIENPLAQQILAGRARSDPSDQPDRR